MTSRKTIGGLAALGAVFAIAACGGDDALSKSEFVKKADAICAKGEKEIDQAGEGVFGEGQEPSEEEITQFGEETVIPNVEQQVDDIRALDPPKDDEDTVNEILDAADEGVDQFKDDPSLLAQEEDPPGFKKADKLATDYGLKKCGGDDGE